MANELITREDIVRGKLNFDAFDKYLDGAASEQVSLPSGKKVKTRAGVEKELKDKFPDSKAGLRDVGTSVGNVAVMTPNGVSSTGLGAIDANPPIAGATRLTDYRINGVFNLPSSTMQSFIDAPADASASNLHNFAYNGGRYLAQFLMPISSNRILCRNCSDVGGTSESVSPWAELYHSKNTKPYTTTTATSANVVVTSTGELQRSTSSKLFKKDIADIQIDDYRAALKSVRPVSYRSTNATSDRTDWSWYSFIAEEIAAIDPRLAQMDNVEFFEDIDEEGNTFINSRELPEGEYAANGINTNGIVALMVHINQQMLADIEALEKEKTAMKTRMTKLEGRMDALENPAPKSAK